VEGHGSIYALDQLDGGVGFFQVKAGTAVSEGKAYLVSNAGVKGYLFEGDDATGINGLRATANGQWYNLAGQRLSRPVRGVNVSKGRKVVK